MLLNKTTGGRATDGRDGDRLCLEALARLTVVDVPSWRVSGAEDGADFLHEDGIRCAAEEPLVPVKDNMTFDSDSFHRRLLVISDPAGEA